ERPPEAADRRTGSADDHDFRRHAGHAFRSSPWRGRPFRPNAPGPEPMATTGRGCGKCVRSRVLGVAAEAVLTMPEGRRINPVPPPPKERRRLTSRPPVEVAQLVRARDS